MEAGLTTPPAGCTWDDVQVWIYLLGQPFPTEVGTTFALQHSLADAVRTSIDRARFPLVLAGNCSSALGTVSGIRAGSRTR